MFFQVHQIGCLYHLKTVLSCKNNLLGELHIQTVSVVGTGKVATHIGMALQAAGVNILQVYGRNAHKAEQLAKLLHAESTDDPNQLLPHAGLILIAVSDDAIATIAARLQAKDAIVVHTSGFTDMQIFAPYHNHYGVFYPLQTFSENRKPDYAHIPFFLEASDADTGQALQTLARKISKSVYTADSTRRRKLHLAAVFACNFANSMYGIAQELLEKEGLDFSLLHPLILETAAKATQTNPREAQTGPARRNDHTTLNAHLEILQDIPEWKALYEQLTNHILKKYNP